jgi:hypothetical protein
MEPVPETLYLLNHLTRLIAREDYIKLCHNVMLWAVQLPDCCIDRKTAVVSKRNRKSLKLFCIAVLSHM